MPFDFRRNRSGIFCRSLKTTQKSVTGCASFSCMNASDKTCPSCKRLEKHVELLKDMVNSLVDDNNALRERIRQLEEKANQDSSNSSKPPSSDFPPKKRGTKKPKSKRKRGAQPGHANQQRKLLPRDQVDPNNTAYSARGLTRPKGPSGCRSSGARVASEPTVRGEAALWNGS